MALWIFDNGANDVRKSEYSEAHSVCVSWLKTASSAGRITFGVFPNFGQMIRLMIKLFKYL